MAAQDYVGRIDKESFLVSLGLFLALAIIAVIGRSAVRFGIQKSRIQLDDGLLLAACVFLLASQITLYTRVVDPMFLMTAIQYGIQGVIPPPNVIQISEDYHRWTVASLMLSWCAISSVKFFFLVFFKKLIDRLRPWQIYWWIIFTYNIILTALGITVYYASCPFWDIRALQCATGSHMASLVRLSAAQISFDILGDLLILAIPAGLIWKIQVDLRQKLVLACSLGLTIVLVALTITRVAGIKDNGSVDSVWETYWQSISAELGVFLAAASAFRAFFVSRKQDKGYKPYNQQLMRSPKESYTNPSRVHDTSTSDGESILTLGNIALDFPTRDIVHSDSGSKDSGWGTRKSTISQEIETKNEPRDHTMISNWGYVRQPEPVICS